MKYNSPILVTGSHRSGTSWVGEMIGFSERVGSIWEPFNVYHRAGICRAKFDLWYPLVDRHNANLYRDDLQDCLAFKYNLGAEILSLRSFYDFARMGKDFLRFGWLRLLKKRPLQKDPIAFFSAEWLAETFDMQVIVLIRHPAAFVSSLKIRDWQFPFDHFVKQPRLLNGKLAGFKDEIISYAQEPRAILDQACLLWRMIHVTAYQYQKSHPDWLFLRHEDLSNAPEEKFSAVFDFLRLDYTDDIRTKIRLYTGTQNPSEQVHARSVRRNSRENIFNWKKRLSPAEITQIFENTADIAPVWYGNSEW